MTIWKTLDSSFVWNNLWNKCFKIWNKNLNISLVTTLNGLYLEGSSGYTSNKLLCFYLLY